MTPTSGGFLHRAVHHWGDTGNNTGDTGNNTGDTGNTGDRKNEFDGSRSTQYERLARWTLRGLYRRVADDLAGLAPPSGVLLDVGTGPGLLLQEALTRRPDLVVEGVDVSPDMVALAERLVASGGTAGRATVQVADVAALPHADHSVDVAVATLSMHHWPDPAGSATQLARVLRPGWAAGRVRLQVRAVGRDARGADPAAGLRPGVLDQRTRASRMVADQPVHAHPPAHHR